MIPRVAFFSLVISISFTVVYLSTTSKASPVAAPVFHNRVILIRHAEKGNMQRPPLEKRGWWEGKMPRGGPPNGLNEKGYKRAEYLRSFFGKDSTYNFGLIFAAPRTPAEKDTERTYATVAPLAKDLGLEINIDCANEDASCIARAVAEFAETSDADILISWKHRELHVIATALGAVNAKIHYPDERNDIVWIMRDGAIVEKLTQHCPELDDGRVDSGDPDLAIEPLPQGWQSADSEKQIVFGK
ncbi:hypothetical protein T439DRAFT_289968 [Meredithblackwellia eburnea MCA 4105]